MSRGPTLLQLPYLGRTLNIVGGPFKMALQGDAFRVKLAAELQDECDYAIDIVDFTAPEMSEYVTGLRLILEKALDGKVVYIGCMGGIGRTGVFIAGLLRVIYGYDKATAFSEVRRIYHPDAVEVAAQEDVLAALDAAKIDRLMRDYTPQDVHTLESATARVFARFRSLLPRRG